MKLWEPHQLPKTPDLNLAVVGHVELVTFLEVDRMPRPGIICHAKEYLKEPAGGGAVVAIELAKILKKPVRFITALGKDDYGKSCFKRLKELGLNISVAWRDQPTRRAFSFITPEGERGITVIGERLAPSAEDPLPWNELNEYDGIFITATDAKALINCRKAPFIAATPRLKLEILQKSGIRLDALIGSGLDPSEQIPFGSLTLPPVIQISTEGELGGYANPGGRYKAFKLDSPVIDSYGCGDCFAAGVTVGLSANWTNEQSISLGAYRGAQCALHFGPY